MEGRTGAPQYSAPRQRRKAGFCYRRPRGAFGRRDCGCLAKIGIACVGPTNPWRAWNRASVYAGTAFPKSNSGESAVQKFRFHGRNCRISSGAGRICNQARRINRGKGVKISGAHLFSTDEAVRYSEELFQNGHPAVVIEEKLDGEEFSLQSFCDGTAVIDMVVVQDHKRALEDDTGPNTGGMGSYSCADHRCLFYCHNTSKQPARLTRPCPKRS